MAADRSHEVVDLAAEGLYFFVAAAEHGPLLVVGPPEFRFLPADVDCAGGAIDADVVRQLFVETPGQVDAAHDAGGAADEHPHGVLHGNVLDAAALDDLDFDQRPEKVAEDIDRM